MNSHDMTLPHLYLDLHPITAKAHHTGPLAIELRQGAGEGDKEIRSTMFFHSSFERFLDSMGHAFMHK